MMSDGISLRPAVAAAQVEPSGESMADDWPCVAGGITASKSLCLFSPARPLHGQIRCLAVSNLWEAASRRAHKLLAVMCLRDLAYISWCVHLNHREVHPERHCTRLERPDKSVSTPKESNSILSSAAS